jgi:hypothetical protein
MAQGYRELASQYPMMLSGRSGSCSSPRVVGDCVALVRHAHAAADPVLHRLVQLLVADQLDLHAGLAQEAEPAGFGERQAVEQVEPGDFAACHAGTPR